MDRPGRWCSFEKSLLFSFIEAGWEHAPPVSNRRGFRETMGAPSASGIFLFFWLCMCVRDQEGKSLGGRCFCTLLHTTVCCCLTSSPLPFRMPLLSLTQLYCCYVAVRPFARLGQKKKVGSLKVMWINLFLLFDRFPHLPPRRHPRLGQTIVHLNKTFFMKSDTILLIFPNHTRRRIYDIQYAIVFFERNLSAE